VVSGSAVEEAPFVLGLEDNSFLGPGPEPKEKAHFGPCAMSKWLNIDIMVMLLRFADMKKLVKEGSGRFVSYCLQLYETMRGVFILNERKGCAEMVEESGRSLCG